MKYIFVFLVVFSLSSQVSAKGQFSSDALRAYASALNIHSSAVVSQAKVGLISLGQITKELSPTSDEAHAIFADMVDNLRGVRAVIYIDRIGALTYDSFSNPVPNVDLSKRDYFIAAQKLADGQIYIGKPVKGKTSSIPFVPIATPVIKDGRLLGVLAAVLTPDALVTPNNPRTCLHCVSLVTDLEGNIIAQQPYGFILKEDLKKAINATQLAGSGSMDIKAGSLQARVHWFRAHDYPLISLFLEFVKRQ